MLRRLCDNDNERKNNTHLKSRFLENQKETFNTLTVPYKLEETEQPEYSEGSKHPEHRYYGQQINNAHWLYHKFDLVSGHSI